MWGSLSPGHLFLPFGKPLQLCAEDPDLDAPMAQLDLKHFLCSVRLMWYKCFPDTQLDSSD